MRGNRLLLVLALGWIADYAQAEFPAGHVVVSELQTVYLVNPVTGISQKLIETEGFLGDVVYNPVTDSIFVTTAREEERSILELKWTDDTPFAFTPFLSGLDRVEALAVDPDGHLYFNQRDFLHHEVWRADLDGNTSQITNNDDNSLLFVPSHLALHPDSSQLYVTTKPSNNVESMALQNGELAHFVEDLSFPNGIDVASDGTIFLTENGSDESIDRVLKVTPEGDATVYAEQPWMEFLGTGFWGDLEYDDRDGTIYVSKGGTLHAINANLGHREIFSERFESFVGLDLIEGFTLSVGDLDGDGQLTVADIDMLCSEVAAGSHPMHADLSGDGLVDGDDVSLLLASANRRPGDADFDGRVEFGDFLAVANNFGEKGKTWSHGDFDCNGEVAFLDFLTLADNFGESGGDIAATPEPEASALLLAALTVLVSLRKRFDCR